MEKKKLAKFALICGFILMFPFGLILATHGPAVAQSD
jgi:hypothetical protein